MGFFSKFLEEKNSFATLPIFNEALSFPLPSQWSIEPTQRSVENGTFLIEFQDPKDDHNKLIVQGFHNANVDVELNAKKLLKMMQEEMASLDPEQFYSETLWSDSVLSKDKIIVIMGLKSLPEAPTTAQFGLFMVLEGQKDIYIVQRSWKGRPNKEGFLVSRQELHRWLEDFKMIGLSSIEEADR